MLLSLTDKMLFHHLQHSYVSFPAGGQPGPWGAPGGVGRRVITGAASPTLCPRMAVNMPVWPSMVPYIASGGGGGTLCLRMAVNMPVWSHSPCCSEYTMPFTKSWRETWSIMGSNDSCRIS